MMDLESMLGAAQGHAPSREFLAARDGLTGAQRRAAGRAVRHGEAAEDPLVARLAVAQARMVLRRREDPGRMLIAAASVVAFAALAVWAFARGHIAIGLALAATAASVAVLLWHQGPPAVVLAGDAERANRDALERAGRPYVEDPEGAEPARWAPAVVVAGLVAMWIITDLAFGAVRVLSDEGPLTLGAAVRSGALAATLFTVLNLAWTRRRMRRQSQRPPGGHTLSPR